MRDIFQAEHIPVYDAATDACFKMLRGYIDYGQFLARRKLSPQVNAIAKPPRPGIDAILTVHRGAAMLPQAATVELLKAYGFQCAASASATTVSEAKAAASQLGYPVILKATVPNVAHRSDGGLVSRKISDDGELGSEFAAIAAKAAAQTSGAVAISVEKFVAHDLEVILGVKYDATFGPVLLCGLGGIFTEVLKDFSLRLAPLAKLDATEMLAGLKAFPVVKKVAGRVDLLTDALMRLSDLAVELNGKIQAVDINPLGLADDSSVGVVLDAKIHL